MAQLSAYACMQANSCFDCGGELRDDNGTYYEYLAEDSHKALAAPICRFCKTLLVLSGGHYMAGSALALWSKETVNERQIIERRYVVNADGTVVTRRDTWNLSRDLSSLQTSGWELYKVKTKVQDALALVELVGKALETQGYRRLF